MNNNPEITKQDADMAQFRFALIAPVVQGLFPDASATAYYKRVTENPLTLPDGTVVKYSYKTLEKWKSEYTNGGLDALLLRGGDSAILTQAATAFGILGGHQMTGARLVVTEFSGAAVSAAAVTAGGAVSAGGSGAGG